jgi:hypothetical protein
MTTPSLPPLDLALDQPTLMVMPWEDAVVNSRGHGVHSSYVETFWLPVLGPTALFVMRRIDQGFGRFPHGYELDLCDTAKEMGLGFTGSASPFARALTRLVMFGAAQPIDDALAVRRRMPRVAHRHLMRMPIALRESHRAWMALDASDAPDAARAATLAAAMLAAGDERAVVERQLLALGVSPLAAQAVGDGLLSASAA